MPGKMRRLLLRASMSPWTMLALMLSILLQIPASESGNACAAVNNLQFCSDPCMWHFACRVRPVAAVRGVVSTAHLRTVHFARRFHSDMCPI